MREYPEDRYDPHYDEHEDDALGAAKGIVVAMLITVGFGLLAVLVLAVVA